MYCVSDNNNTKSREFIITIHHLQNWQLRENEAKAIFCISNDTFSDSDVNSTRMES